MCRAAIALILVALQSFATLPGRLHLCFEGDGALCCIQGGEHECECDHECPSREGGAHATMAQDHDECCGCDKELNAEAVCDDSSHQHVVINLGAQETVLRRTIRLDNEELFVVFAMAPFAEVMFPVDGRVVTPDRAHSDSLAAPFSLFARASTVLRC